jgi:ferric-dicitrate binding protein FerR (iron transport regulator)
MAKTRQAKAALPYLRRLADDEYVHEQLRHAFNGVSGVSRRIARKRGRAAEDKQLYANLRQAAISARNASRALRRKPEPKRRGRKFIAVAALAGGIAVLVSQRAKVKSVFSRDVAGAQSPNDNVSSQAGSTEAAAPDQASVE